MNRLKTPLALTALCGFALLCHSCSGSSGADTLSPAPDSGDGPRQPVGRVEGNTRLEQGNETASSGSVLEHVRETASYAGLTQIQLGGLSGGPEKAEPPLGALPELPIGELPSRLPSEVTQFDVNGSDSFIDSANSADSGTSRILSAPAGGVSFAIYQIPDVADNTELLKIVVNTSDGSFAGTQAGFWFGMANYDKGAWQPLALSQSTAYQRTFSDTTPFRSPDGHLYAFILIYDGQAVTINDLTADLETTAVAWQEIEITAGPYDGWTPSMVLNLVGDPMVVYADYGRENVYFTMGDRSDGLLDGTNWSPPTELDPFPPFTDSSSGNKIHYCDMTFDQQFLSPLISMVYEGEFDENKVPGGVVQESSMLCFAPYITGEEGFRLYYGLWIDGAKVTSIDRDDLNPAYGIALCADNVNWDPVRPRNDLEVRYIEFNLGQVPSPGDGLDIQVTRNFGNEWDVDFLNPHLQFDPLTGNELIAANGAHLFSNDKANTQWLYLVPEVTSGDFGSIAFNPDNDNPAHIYTQVSGVNRDLKYFDNVFSPTPDVDTVDSTGQSGQDIGLCQEIAFAPDGRPHLAYTEYDGSDLYVRYAFFDGLSWVLEDISPEANVVPVESAGLRLDIVVQTDGTPCVVYNHVSAEDSSVMRFAMRVTE